MAESKQKPDIRFAGFTDTWEQRKLNELFEENNERNEEKYTVERTISISSMSFNPVGNGADEASLAKYKVLRIGDVAFEGHTNKEFSYGRFVMNDIGNGIMSPRFTTLRPKFAPIVDFWKYYIHYEPIMKSILIRSTKAGTMMNELVVQDLLMNTLMIPKDDEQREIGRLFVQLDNLITLHQREYDKIVNIKKAMLNKMFPKNGEDKPEIRFAGFTDAWEQRKLGEIAEFNPKAELPETFEYVDLESVVGTEMISHRKETKETAPSRAQRLARVGDLFYQTVRPYQRNNHLFEKDDNVYVFSTGYAQMRPQTDGYFLLSFVQTEMLVKAVLDRCTGTSYPAINAYDLAEMFIRIPIMKQEQKQIGAYFRNLDNLITLHQCELKKLQNIKKTLLGKMFV